MTKQYEQRNIESLDGYMTHVMAMTAEQPHSKSDIAGELAWRDSQIAALQQKLDAMAAENAALKTANSIAINILNDEETMVTSLWASSVRKVEVSTPATDAYLNSVRAEGVGLVKSHPAISLVSLTHICDQIAEQLRSGTHDTADKAG